MSDGSLPCAVVTGGSAGIGRAICEALLGEGQRVVSLDRAPASFAHPRLTSVEVDLADREATRKAAAEVAATYAPTTLVHNAGVIRPALLADVQLADLDASSNCIWSRRSSWCRRCCPECASGDSAASS